MAKQKILFVLTGHGRLGPSNATSADKTGFHLAEAAQPWKVLTDAGFDIDFATPKGGKAPIDPSSMDLDDADNAEFMNDGEVRDAIERSQPLSGVTLGEYDAIYFPGGHGTMWDLPDNADVQNAVRTLYESGKVVAAVCHGPAALVNVKVDDGSWLVDGKTLSVFTDSEEKAVDKDDVVPFLLATKLAKRGATIREADDFEAAVSVSDRLITGQNPASARGVGEAIRDLLKERRSEAA